MLQQRRKSLQPSISRHQEIGQMPKPLVEAFLNERLTSARGTESISARTETLL